MPDGLERLWDRHLSGRSLFALRRIAEALEADLLTLSEADRAAERISPRYVGIFLAPITPRQRATQVVRTIEAVLQKRFPGRFRAS